MLPRPQPRNRLLFVIPEFLRTRFTIETGPPAKHDTLVGKIEEKSRMSMNTYGSSYARPYHAL